MPKMACSFRVTSCTSQISNVAINTLVGLLNSLYIKYNAGLCETGCEKRVYDKSKHAADQLATHNLLL